MCRLWTVLLVCGYGCAATGAQSSLEQLRRSAKQLWSQGELAQAAKQYREVLSLDEKSGDTSLHVAADLYANGSLAVEMDQLSDAKVYFQRSMDRVRGKPLSEAQLRSSIGSLLALEGNFSEAEANLKMAIAGFAKYAGTNDLRTAKAWNSLGWVYMTSGSMNKAGAALDRAQSIVDHAMAPDSTERVPFLDYHAEFLAQMARYSEAERLWHQALAIVEKSLGTGQPQFDVLLLHLGHMYASIGEYSAAKEALERFLSIEEKAVPGGSLAQGVALGELGNVYAHLKDNANAEPTLAKSMDMLRSIPGNVPLAGALVGTYLGDYFMSRQRWSEAADQYRQVLDTRQKLVPNTALVAGTMNAFSMALDKLKEKAAARRYKKQAEAILAEQRNPVYRGYTVDVKSFSTR